jgi:hypothetical protein
MKKAFLLILISILLLSCQISNTASQGVSDAEMATRVAKILTTMPTETPLPRVDTATLPPPTATLPPAATETPAPTATATLTAVPTQTPTPLPSATELPSPTPAATNTPPPTIAPSTNDPRDRLGPPVSADAMDDGTFWSWGVGASEFTSVSFDGSFMNLTGLTTKAGWRMPAIKTEQDFYVEMTAYSGPCTSRDSYGIIFRVPNHKEPTQGYVYEVSCDGYFKLWKWDGLDGPDGTSKLLLGWKASSYIRTGQDQPNRVGVMAIEGHIYLFINGHRVGEYSDISYPAGSFGIVINPDKTANYTVRIDDMSYWNNPVP